jgi:hypothetical protein
MTGTNCDLFTHKSSRSYLNHLVEEKFPSTQCIRDDKLDIEKEVMLIVKHLILANN